jgi:hypothetical protein
VLYGILAGSLRRPRPLYGLPFGVVVWAGDCLILPVAGLYKPIWEYEAKTLDLVVLARRVDAQGTFHLVTANPEEHEAAIKEMRAQDDAADEG